MNIRGSISVENQEGYKKNYRGRGRDHGSCVCVTIRRVLCWKHFPCSGSIIQLVCQN